MTKMWRCMQGNMSGLFLLDVYDFKGNKDERVRGWPTSKNIEVIC